MQRICGVILTALGALAVVAMVQWAAASRGEASGEERWVQLGIGALGVVVAGFGIAMVVAKPQPVLHRPAAGEPFDPRQHDLRLLRRPGALLLAAALLCVLACGAGAAAMFGRDAFRSSTAKTALVASLLLIGYAIWGVGVRVFAARGVAVWREPADRNRAAGSRTANNRVESRRGPHP